MDYSQLSDSDLIALKTKDYSKMSDQGLMALKQINAERQQALKAAAPKPFNPAESQDQKKLESGQISQDPASRAPQGNVNAIQGSANSLDDLIRNKMHDPMAANFYQETSKELSPENIGFKFSQSTPIGPIEHGLKGIAPYLKQGASAIGDLASRVAPNEAAQSAIGVVSPRLASAIKLAKLLGKVAPEGEGAATSAAVDEASSLAAPKVGPSTPSQAPSPTSIRTKDIFKTRKSSVE